MAKLTETDWDLINAHIDGELTSEDELELSRRLVEDASLTAALAEMQSVKAALSLIKPPEASEQLPTTTCFQPVAAMMAAVAMLNSINAVASFAKFCK